MDDDNHSDDILAQQVEDIFATTKDPELRAGLEDLVRTIPGPDEPYAVAKLLAALGVNVNQPFKSWGNSFYLYTGQHWRKMPDATMRSRVYAYLDGKKYLGANGNPTAWKPGKGNVGGIMHALHAKVDAFEETLTQDDGAIPVANGWLLPSTRALQPHTSARFNLFASTVRFDPKAPKPSAWLNFLDDVLPDQESQNLLGEWFGYVLSGRTDLQKALMLKGAPRSGKGTMTTVLQEMIGPGGHVGISMAMLGERFGLEPVIGKSLGVIGDARMGSNSSIAVERLLSITGEDMVSVEEKNKPAFSIRMPLRIMLLTNEMPNLRDASTALANRFLVLETGQSFLGREDVGLRDRLMAELPGILNWALDGLDRLNEQRGFTVPVSSAQATDDLVRTTSPLSAFVADECEVSEGAVVPASALFGHFKEWCASNGFQATNSQQFGSQLRSTLPRVDRKQRRIDGKQQWCYTGIAVAEGR